MLPRRKKPVSLPSRPMRSIGTTRFAWGWRRGRHFRRTPMTGLEANLRFAGPETMETKIFAPVERVAELDLPAAECRRGERRPEGVRATGQAGVQLGESVKTY